MGFDWGDVLDIGDTVWDAITHPVSTIETIGQSLGSAGLDPDAYRNPVGVLRDYTDLTPAPYKYDPFNGGYDFKWDVDPWGHSQSNKKWYDHSAEYRRWWGDAIPEINSIFKLRPRKGIPNSSLFPDPIESVIEEFNDWFGGAGHMHLPNDGSDPTPWIPEPKVPNGTGPGHRPVNPKPVADEGIPYQLYQKKNRRRKRTRNSFTDELVGVEMNPGPPRKQHGKKKGGKPHKKNIKRKTHTVSSRGATVATSERGGRRLNNNHVISSRMFKGNPAVLVTGCCLLSTLKSNASSNLQFTDPAGLTASSIYVNPWVMPSNAGVATPTYWTPMQFTAGAYRKFCFVGMQLMYEPTVASTTDTTTVALAFLPDVATTGTATSTTMAMLECSAYGPSWRPLSLNCTRFLDTSRWYGRELNSGNTGIVESYCQGSLMVNYSDTASAANKVYGIIKLYYAFYAYDQSPGEFSTSPTMTEAIRKKAEYLDSISKYGVPPDEEKQKCNFCSCGCKYFSVVDGKMVCGGCRKQTDVSSGSGGETEYVLPTEPTGTAAATASSIPRAGGAFTLVGKRL